MQAKLLKVYEQPYAEHQPLTMFTKTNSSVKSTGGYIYKVLNKLS